MSERTPDDLLAYLIDYRWSDSAFAALDAHCRAGRLPTAWTAALEDQLAAEIADGQEKALAWGEAVTERDTLREQNAKLREFAWHKELCGRHHGRSCDCGLAELLQADPEPRHPERLGEHDCETDPNYREAMRDAGRGHLLP